MGKRMLRRLAFLAMALLPLCVVGCGNKEGEEPFPISVADAVLLYEEEICPNESYAEREEDRVFCRLEIYQKEDNTIVVNADSNSAFFEGLQYTVEAEEPLTQEGIAVEWLTMAGSAEASKENQKCAAAVKLFENGEVFHERTIYYIGSALEMAGEAIEKTP